MSHLFSQMEHPDRSGSLNGGQSSSETPKLQPIDGRSVARPTDQGSPPGETPTGKKQETRDLADVFKLLSDVTRLRILFLLCEEEELNVRTMCELLGQSQPAVSHHLALMRVGGLIEPRRSGKHNFYRLVPDRMREAVRAFAAFVPGHLDSVCNELMQRIPRAILPEQAIA